MTVLSPYEGLGEKERAIFATADALARGPLAEAEAMADDAEGERHLRKAAQAEGLFDLAQRSGREALLSLVVVRERLAATGGRRRHAALGPSPGLLQQASPALQERFGQPVMAGLKHQAFAFTDDPRAPVTAEPTPGGFRLSGRKSFVTGGRRADHFLVYARSPEGPLMLVVEAEAPGVSRGDFFETLDGGQHCALSLDGAFVPEAHSLGTPGQGQRQAFDQINRTRLTLAAEAVGLMAYAVHRAASHLQATRPDGIRLADREGAQLRFAELWMAVFTARSTLYRVAQQFSGAVPSIPAGAPAGALAAAPEALSALKVLASETAEQVLSGALQLCGAQALRSDDPLTRCYREVRSWQFAEGASDLLRLSIAKARLEKGRGAL